MLNSSAAVHRPSVLAIAPRVVAITFAISALSFALLLLVGIVGTALFSAVSHQPLDMTTAYRHFAIPAIKAVVAITFVGAWVLEIRHYLRRRAEALAAEAGKGQS
jgi:hypothetical protein